MTEYIIDWDTGLVIDTFSKNMLREEIVRCRDCKYADETESGLLLCNGYLVESWDWYNDMPNDGVKVKPDGYCAWSCRRSDKE